MTPVFGAPIGFSFGLGDLKCIGTPKYREILLMFDGK